jgi:hypothetical protein
MGGVIIAALTTLVPVWCLGILLLTPSLLLPSAATYFPFDVAHRTLHFPTFFRDLYVCGAPSKSKVIMHDLNASVLTFRHEFLHSNSHEHSRTVAIFVHACNIVKYATSAVTTSRRNA